MDRDIDVRTPESVEFRYELAGLGSRCIAMVLDTIAQVVVLLLIFWGIFSLASGAGPSISSASDDKWATSIGIAIVVAIVFVVFYGYFILFEIFWNGQTPGKKLLGIRVVRDGGYPIDFGASFLRNVIRIGEQALFFYGVSAIVTLTSSENKRIGDYAAGTIVIREAKSATTAEFLRATFADAPASSVVLSAQERQVVREFLERRDAFSWDRRRELAERLAARFRPRVGPDLAGLYDEQLLERL